ncbi:hypothetical protein CD170_09510 [Staphylococcus aureus]|nr:hypothetical protein CD170_09510 [Staphylococcus aureus]
MYLFINKLYHNYFNTYFMEGISGNGYQLKKRFKRSTTECYDFVERYITTFYKNIILLMENEM